jgi:hypothetical protein
MSPLEHFTKPGEDPWPAIVPFTKAELPSLNLDEAIPTGLRRLGIIFWRRPRVYKSLPMRLLRLEWHLFR